MTLPPQYEHMRGVPLPKKNPDAFIDPFHASITFIQGNRGEGKSSVDELISEYHFLAGHTIVDLHSASNYESLYWCVNHGCEIFWNKWRAEEEKKPEYERAKEPLHCNCNTRYKIVLVVPDYVEFDEDALDEFNGRFYTKKEWSDLGNLEYGTIITKQNGEKVRQRPVRPDYVQWIKVRKLSIPNKGYKNRDQFVKELTEIMMVGRDERRIVVFNPVFYNNMNHKLLHLEKTLREIPEIVRSKFKSETTTSVAKLRGVEESVPMRDWTVQEHNRHRVTILMREFGSLVASQLNEEKNQVIVKKAVFALVKVVRHFHISLVGDFQRANDILASVREQRDYFIWKCSNIDIMSEDYHWLRTDIKANRDMVIEKAGLAMGIKLYPNIEDLKPNQMYVLYPKKNEKGNRYKLFTITMPNFHHHQQDDDFETESGIIREDLAKGIKGTWRFVTKNKEGQLVDSKQDEVNEDKKVKEANMERIWDLTYSLMTHSDPKKKMKAQEIFDHIGTLNLRPVGWTMSAFRKWYSRQKKLRGKS